MKRLIFISIFACISIFLIDCRKKSPDNSATNCELLSSALSIRDTAEIATQIDIRASWVGRIPKKASWSQVDSLLKRFVNGINEDCNITARLFCTECIETFSPMSEIGLIVPTDRGLDSVTIDLVTNAGDWVKFVGLH